MSNALDRWLQQATRCLSHDATARVATEIREHYELTRETAVRDGATSAEADARALAALGDAKTANRQYRKVLFTVAEARLLREGDWECRVVRSHRRARWLARGFVACATLAAAVLFYTGRTEVARILLLASFGMGFLLTAPFLPIYTPARSRAVRCLKWAFLAGLPLLAFGADAARFSWLLVAMLWPVFWVEWTRMVIRRKLPVAQWPKHLYL